MRVNIITQPLFCNYGGILQNYALQEVLRRLGHDPLTINVPVKGIRKSASWKDYIKSGRNLIRKIRGNYECLFLNPHTYARKERELSFPQREFVSQYISKIDVPTPFTSDTEKRYKADLWIVGSDQVWRPWCSPNIGNYFFDFLKGSTKRISYAASFGTDKWEIDTTLTPSISKLAKRFNSISIREESGVDLCSQYLNVEAKHVLDPTMLLTAEDYLRLTSEKDYPKGQYIATYILDQTKEKKKIIKNESKEKNLPVRKVGAMNKAGFDSIEFWLATIAHAECVITDSFHGTVFSILFNRPVKVLANNLRGNSRLQSLFNMLNLKPDTNGYIRLSNENIDRLNLLREKSISFLTDALNNND